MEGQPGSDDKLKSSLPSLNKNNSDIQMQAPTFQDSIPMQPKAALPIPPALPTVPTAGNFQPMNPLLIASPLVSRKRQLPHHLNQDMHVPVLNSPKSPKSPGGGTNCLPAETVEYLKAWMMSPEHVAHPYPTEKEKAKIMAETGIELKQLTNWFVNNRKRYWKPRVEARQAAALAGVAFPSIATMDLATGANYVNNNANMDLMSTSIRGGGGKMPGRKSAPPGSGKQRKVPTKKRRRKSMTKYKAKANGRLKKSSMPKTTLKIVSDERPNRITNPLLATLPPKNSMDEVYGSELYRAMEVVFHPPDTYPLSYYARVLGFDVPVVDDQKMPAAFPDVATLPLVSARKDDPFLEVPKEERRLEYKKVNSLGQDLDDQLTLDYVDPVYATLIQKGFSTKELVPCNHSLFSKFDAKRKQSASKQLEVVTLGKSIIPSFDPHWTFSGYPALKTERKAILEEYQWTIEENPVPSSLPTQTFGVIAWLRGKPEAILMYQFMWYSLSNNTKESELVMVITGIGRPRRKPKVTTIPLTTDVVVDAKMLGCEFATTPESPSETPNTELNGNSSCLQEDPANSSQASTLPSEVKIPGLSESLPATVQVSEKSNEKSDFASNEEAQNIPAPLDETVITTMIAMILEHTRACNVFYGLWEAPKNSLGFVEECFRLSKVPSKGNDDAERMVCDLKKSSSRYAFLKLIEKELEAVSAIKDSIDVCDRLLVRLPNLDEAKSCFEPSATIVPQRLNRKYSRSIGNLFTGAAESMREATFGIRALTVQDGDAPQVKIHALEGKFLRDQLQLPGSSGTDSSLEILKSFPIPTSTQIDENEETNEILLDLKRKQNELIQIERGLEPNLRSLMSKIIDERIEYEKPESRQKRADEVRILEEHRRAVERRKEIDQQMQEQLEQDMNAVCSICGDGEVTPDNQILFCEACDIPVHQMCYGVEKVPEGDYYCVACKHLQRDKMKQSLGAREPMPVLPVQCELCPVQYGAYVRCELPKDSPPDAPAKWVHMGCAKWQGLNFSEPLNPECVEDVSALKREFRRLDYACDICRGKRGAYHQCSHNGCDKWMHMTCARICGLCEVNYGEDVEGNPTEKPWTLYCQQHSVVDPEDTGYKRFSLDELIAMAKEFPEEPMPVAPPPKNRIFNKMNGQERTLALANPEYERAFLDELLTKRFAGVRCECCDEDQDGSLLQRCTDCLVTVCVNCRISPGKVSADQKYIKCLSCSYKSACAKEGNDFDEPQCDLCYAKGGLLMHGKAKPITRASFWKNNPKLFKKSIFGKKLWAHYSCAFWSKNVHVIAQDCSAECSDVVMSNGQGYVQGKIPCYLCGKMRGMKTRCSDINCRARGEKKQPYHFHVSCARQAGFEVNVDEELDEQEQFYIRCYQHGGNAYNVRARLEDLIEVERRRSGKKLSKADAPMSFNDASRLLNCAMLVVRMLGWAWRWAELWVEHDSTWEPLLEPGQKEENMTKAQLKIIDSTPQSRCKDARQCRLTAFGAALRNRNYDDEGGFDNESLNRAFRAVLHTKSLVGPWKEFEIDFLADWLSRAYRSKSRLLGLGDDKIPIGNASFCYHADDKSPKFELGNRPLPGKATLNQGQIFEVAVTEPDDFLKPEIIDGEVVTPTVAPKVREIKQERSVSPKAVPSENASRQKRGPGRPRRSTEEEESGSPFDKSAGLAALIPSAMKKRRAPSLDSATEAATSKRIRRFNENIKRAHATIPFDKLDPDGPLRRGRRGRPPRLFELSVVMQVDGQLLERDGDDDDEEEEEVEVHDLVESQAGAAPHNAETPGATESEGVDASAAELPVQVNGKHTKTLLINTKLVNNPASEPTANLPNDNRKRRVGEMSNTSTSTSSIEQGKKAENKTTQKRADKRGERRSLGKINYAENSDDSDFEEENDGPIESIKASPVKKPTRRKTQTGDSSHTVKHNASKAKVDTSNDDNGDRHSGKRVRGQRASSTAGHLQQASSVGTNKKRQSVQKEDIYESEFFIPLAELASQSRNMEGSHKGWSEGRTDIDPIHMALEQSQKQAPYTVTKPERLEGKKAAARGPFIK